VVPELAHNATRWPYAVIGIGFALYGIALIAFGTRRIATLDREIGVAPADRPAARAMWVLASVGVILGIATIPLILAP
jgi:uncharacterized membrane protein YidH (DUF202 family)